MLPFHVSLQMLVATKVKKLSAVVEPSDSLPFLQKPNITTYQESVEFNPHFLGDSFNIVLNTNLQS
jgi:hypothetical protein